MDSLFHRIAKSMFLSDAVESAKNGIDDTLEYICNSVEEQMMKDWILGANIALQEGRLQ